MGRIYYGRGGRGGGGRSLIGAQFPMGD